MPDKIIIAKPKGLAQRGTKPHCYTVGKISIAIKTKQIIEKESSVEEEGKPIPINVEETKVSTHFEVTYPLPPKITGLNEGPPTIFFDVAGKADDEACLALMGYYLSDYDEMTAARKIKRLTDIAK